MPSNLGIKRAPCLVLGNFLRNLGLQKGKRAHWGGLGKAPKPSRTLSERLHKAGSSHVCLDLHSTLESLLPLGRGLGFRVQGLGFRFRV